MSKTYMHSVVNRCIVTHKCANNCKCQKDVGGNEDEEKQQKEKRIKKKDDRRAYKEVMMKSKFYKAERKRTKAQCDRMREEVLMPDCCLPVCRLVCLLKGFLVHTCRHVLHEPDLPLACNIYIHTYIRAYVNIHTYMYMYIYLCM
jgi:hypothetical protein